MVGVNVWEASQILEWARVRVRDRTHYKAGQITFFSAIAEWREEPRPMYVAAVDRMELDDMFLLVSAVDADSKSSISILANSLDEKAQNTTPINIEFRGLELMLGLARGCEKRVATVRQERH